MKILVVYYSRTGATRQVAQAVSKMVNADIEEIKDSADRSGIMGFIKSGYEAALDKLTKIEEIQSDLESYDLVVVGAPVWAGKPGTPVTTFIKKYGHKIENFAVFITHADAKNSYDKAIEFLEKAAGKRALKTLSITTAAARRAEEDYNVVAFANELNKL